MAKHVLLVRAQQSTDFVAERAVAFQNSTVLMELPETMNGDTAHVGSATAAR